MPTRRRHHPRRPNTQRPPISSRPAVAGQEITRGILHGAASTAVRVLLDLGRSQ
ncbi:hypothetical protein [Streptomyces sp. MP131-18]|uniref:hypothetical protein n=1 Tax=Streptomyces sp. MP131-18 TaxID=1857892 RepID=UPI0009C5C105|nr:hypothetical protein [Streptomyces sp. MP131-18]ONK09250.1 hypothetical protein STBA_71050 [Streptomyces sp. MP131-18]